MKYSMFAKSIISKRKQINHIPGASAELLSLVISSGLVESSETALWVCTYADSRYSSGEPAQVACSAQHFRQLMSCCFETNKRINIW